MNLAKFHRLNKLKEISFFKMQHFKRRPRLNLFSPLLFRRLMYMIVWEKISLSSKTGYRFILMYTSKVAVKKNCRNSTIVKELFNLKIYKTIELRACLKIRKSRLKLIPQTTEKDRFAVFVVCNQWQVTFTQRIVVYHVFFTFTIILSTRLKAKHKSWKFVNSKSCIAWTLPFFSHRIVVQQYFFISSWSFCPHP